jgi:hypothetical protein
MERMRVRIPRVLAVIARLSPPGLHFGLVLQLSPMTVGGPHSTLLLNLAGSSYVIRW